MVSGVQLQAALIDTGDAPLTPAVAPSSTVIYVPPTSAEQSSRPGVEARVALFGSGQDESRIHVGLEATSLSTKVRSGEITIRGRRRSMRDCLCLRTLN